jgi:hypothetical protein
MNRYLFVLSPPYTGSTLLWKILGTSPSVSSLPREGVQVAGPEVKGTALLEDPNLKVPWDDVKKQWAEKWDFSKPILLEKSPAHIHRAAAIKKHFSPAYFIVLMRDPYAFCEGCTRRKAHYSHQDSARLWVKCAKSQRRNLQEREHVLSVRYEDFTEHPERALQRIIDFIPQVESLHADDVETFTVMGRRRRINNVNESKIKMLRRSEVREVNTVLKSHRDLMHYFDYSVRKASSHSRLQALRVRVLAKTIRAARFLARKGVIPLKVALRAEDVLSE